MKGALWSGGVGMMLGLFSDSSTDDDISRGEMVAAVVMSDVVSGAVIGALVQSERWERVEVPACASLIRTRGRPAAVASLRF